MNVDQETIFKLVVGVVLSGMGWFGRQIWDAVKELRNDLRDLEVDLPKSYVVKTDFTDAMKDLKQQINDGFTRIYDKLDGKADK